MKEFTKVLVLVGVCILGIFAFGVFVIYVNREFNERRLEIQDLKNQLSLVTSRDERITQLEARVVEKQNEIDRIYDDVDSVYRKWSNVEQDILEFKAKFRHCKIEE